MEKISFYVPGLPKGQPRPRAFAFNGKARIYDAGTAEGWKGCVAQAAKPYLPEAPIELPVQLMTTFYMPRPKKHYKKSGLKPEAPHEFTCKPDCDNLAKAIMDCLTVCGMWKDDAQVWILRVAKCYADKQPGVEIEIKY